MTDCVWAGDTVMRFRSRDHYADTTPIGNMQVFSFERLASESVGAFLLTLTNIAIGSAIWIGDQAGTTTMYNGTAATSSPTITLAAYAPGSSLNDLRIRVRKASGSPNYIPYETLMTAIAGATSIYVSQIPDE